MKMLSANRQLIMTNLKYYTYLEKTQIPKWIWTKNRVKMHFNLSAHFSAVYDYVHMDKLIYTYFFVDKTHCASLLAWK